jgi:hypothetical protein
MLFDILVVVSLLVTLLLLRRLVNVYPSLIACLWRAKECFNLESSVKLARDRDIITLAMVIPFCLAAFRFRLYDPGFFQGLSDNSVMGLYFVVFLAYVLMRYAVMLLFTPRRLPQKTTNVANKASNTFFSVLTLLLLAMGGILDLLNVDGSVLRNAMLWVSGAIYAVFLIRKTQIFASSCSIFASFLYLCALEMIPTGFLVVSAVIF